MSTRLPLALFLILVAAAHAADPAHVLVQYDFDTDTVETGPYTLMVFEHSRGSVELTETYRYSGYRSVEIRDVAGDADFAELQGYFRERTSGKVFLHFALMTVTPDEHFNVAFAGPAHFTMRKNGIGVWLKNRDGVLYHVTAREDAPLAALQAFAWYVVDVAYDVDTGTYDLTLREEHSPEPAVSLSDQPNAVGEPGSAIHKFSFIGDVPGTDTSNVHFFIDDISVSVDSPVSQGPFVAPGRRMLFVDLWDYYRRQMYDDPACPPVLDHSDFGLTAQDLYELYQNAALATAEALMDGTSLKTELPRDLPPHLQEVVDALALWRQGCADDPDCDSACEAALFERAASALPGAKLPSMCRVMALAAADRWTEADELFVSVYPEWNDDPRFPALSAVLGLARGDLVKAESELLLVPEELADAESHPLLQRLWTGRLDRQLVAEMKLEFGDSWSDLVAAALVAEHRFYVLLWQERYDEAASYADRMARRFGRLDLPASRWTERKADAAFYAGDHRQALRGYRRSLNETDNATRVLLKLSDTFFLMGDLEKERAYRQKIYGTLESKATLRDPEPGVEFDPCLCPGEDAAATR